MGKSIKHNLYDYLGNSIAEVILPANNFETIIIEYEGKYYRPLFYNMMTNSSQCIEAKVISVKRGEDEDIGSKRESIFTKELPAERDTKID